MTAGAGQSLHARWQGHRLKMLMRDAGMCGPHRKCIMRGILGRNYYRHWSRVSIIMGTESELDPRLRQNSKNCTDQYASEAEQWRWIGHILRMELYRNPPDGKSKGMLIRNERRSGFLGCSEQAHFSPKLPHFVQGHLLHIEEILSMFLNGITNPPV